MESSVHCRHDNTACVAVPLLDVALDVAAAALAVRNGDSPLRLAQDVVHPSNGRKCASRSTTSFSVTLRAGKRFQSTAAAKLLTAFGASVCACVRASVRAFTCARLEQPIVMRPEVAEWKKTFSPVSPCQPASHLCTSHLRVIAAMHFCFSAKSSGWYMSQLREGHARRRCVWVRQGLRTGYF